ncbi:hypothetical protein G9A89_016453 [Geosiphon pyriformis]|nr:hypothetical protein G9A89_016453 [Geosiphon pyriformis]
MAYTPITKLEKFSGEENNVQTWINDIAKAITTNNWDDTKVFQAIFYFLQDAANSWYYSLVQKPQIFDAFKLEFLRYFIINANYFTAAQILNQFICGLCSSILQYICSMHLADLQATVIHTKDFKAAKLEANYAQVINLVMNRLSELDSKLKQFRTVYCPQNQSCPSSLTNQQWQQKIHICHYGGKPGHLRIDYSKLLIKLKTVSTELPTYDTTANLSTTSLLANNTSNLSTTVPVYLLATALSNLSTPTNSNTTTKLYLKMEPKS